MNVYEMEGFLRGKCLPGDMKVNESNAQYQVRIFSEMQSQNAELAVQLANAERKCRELAAESSNKSRCLGFFASVIKSGEEWTSVCEHEYSEAFKTPATDTFLAEVRAQGVEMFAMCIAHRVNYSEVDKSIELDALSFAEGLRNPAPELSPEDVVELAAQLSKGAAL